MVMATRGAPEPPRWVRDGPDHVVDEGGACPFTLPGLEGEAGTRSGRRPPSGIGGPRPVPRPTAGEVEWPALGVGDRQDEHVVLVPFERDHVGESWDGCLADQRACCPRARPCWVGFWGVADSIEES